MAGWEHAPVMCGSAWIKFCLILPLFFTIIRADQLTKRKELTLHKRRENLEAATGPGVLWHPQEDLPKAVWREPEGAGASGAVLG